MFSIANQPLLLYQLHVIYDAISLSEGSGHVEALRISNFV
jgi:hypothetical protein